MEEGFRGNILGFLERPGCNQDENHFSWIFKSLLEANERLRAEFLGRIGALNESESLRAFDAFYQHHSPFSWPDLVLDASTLDRQILVFVETKVSSDVDAEQCRRHVQSLDAEGRLWRREKTIPLFTYLVLLVPREQLQYVPDGLAGVGWNEVHRMLEDCAERGNSQNLELQFAKTLEVRGLADFKGFDITDWKDYLEIYHKQSSLMERVETQGKNFVATVRELAVGSIKSGMAPFKDYSPTVHDRGQKFSFWICPRAVESETSHWAIVKVDLREGWIETSMGTSTLPRCTNLLSFVENNVDKLKDDWQLLYSAHGVREIIYAAQWRRLVDLNLTELSVGRWRYLAMDTDRLHDPGIVDEVFRDMSFVCDLLLDALGTH